MRPLAPSGLIATTRLASKMGSAALRALPGKKICVVTMGAPPAAPVGRRARSKVAHQLCGHVTHHLVLLLLVKGIELVDDVDDLPVLPVDVADLQ